MNQSKSNRSRFSILTTCLGIVVLILFSSTFSIAQNTKGDKPTSNQKSVSKSKKKTRSGKRVRAKGRSSASRAIQSAATRKPSGGNNYQPEGGSKLKIKSSSAQVARNNVYPKNYAYVNKPAKSPKEVRHFSPRKTQVISATAKVSRSNVYPRNYAYVNKPTKSPRESVRIPSRKVRVSSATARVSRNNFFSSHNQYVNNSSPLPKEKQQTFSNGRILVQVARLNTKPQPPEQKKILTSKTKSRSYVTRGRRNVYWGKFKIGERPFVGDITGRPLRAKNFRTPAPPSAPPKEEVKKKGRIKIKNERLFRGDFITGNVTTPGVAKPWKGDISGHAIRTQPPKKIEIAGKMVGGQRMLSITNKRQVIGQPMRTVALVKKTKSGKMSNQPITRKAPGIGAIAIDRSLGRYKGGKKPKLYGSRKGGFNNSGQPVPGRQPGIGGQFIGSYQGFDKATKPAVGGGSITGKFNNKGRPIDVKSPGIGGRFLDTFSGNIKSIRPSKGGGSISGKIFNNKGRAIDAKVPGIGGRFVDTYSGNIKTGKPLKGGGSISGKLWNNSTQPIIGKMPAGLQAKFVDTYQGFHKARKAFSRDGYKYSGNKRIWIEPKGGGGSISGKLWNNSNQPVQSKVPVGSIQAKYVDIYQGYYKAHKPVKGGGSVSGKLWNNKEQPIQGTTYDLSKLKVSSYAGDIKFKRSDKYIKNPNSFELAIKKAKPNKTTYEVAGLQVKTKAHDYALNKHSSKSALKGESEGKNSLKAIEYSNRIKVLWTKTFGGDKDLNGRIPMKKYVHAPNSKKGALMVLSPGRATAQLKDLQVNVKMSKPHGKNLHPDSQFANSLRDNVKHERTFLMNIRLTWAKLFKKSSNQPKAVKEKIRKPRYDKNERELWKDLYD